MELLTDGRRRADECNPFGYFELEAVLHTAKDASWTQQAVGKAVKVIYPALYDLPASFSYRVVFMMRDLGEVLASQDRLLRHLGKEGAVPSGRGMRRIFAGGLMSCARYLAERDNFEVIYVSYGAMLADTLSEAGRVSRFLGGLDTEAMAGAVEPRLTYSPSMLSFPHIGKA